MCVWTGWHTAVRSRSNSSIADHDGLQDIGADYPINPFHPEGHDEDEVDDKLDEDDAEEAFPFTAEEVERLDLAVSLKGEQDWAGVAAMLGARTAEGCKEEWDRRRLRWTAGGEWLGHTMDRRLLAGRSGPTQNSR